MLNVSVLLVISSLLMGCMATIKTSYPNDWPQPQLSNRLCPDIDGEFVLVASRSMPSANTSNRLDGIIFGKFLNDFSTGATAELIASPSTRSVRLALTKAKALPGTGYLQLNATTECIDGWLVIRSQSTYGHEGTTTADERISKLALLEDQSLLIQSRRIRANRSFLVTSWGDDVESWHIFRRP